MKLKHLNVSREGSVKVIIDFEMNHFVAYLVNSEGFPIIFKMTTTWAEMLADSEFQKYKCEWNLPVECSKMVLSKRTQALHFSEVD